MKAYLSAKKKKKMKAYLTVDIIETAYLSDVVQYLLKQKQKAN
jgi:hypothetical protein